MKPVLCWLNIETSGDHPVRDQLLSLQLQTEHPQWPTDLQTYYIRLKHQQIPNLNHLLRYQLNPFQTPFKEGFSEVQLVQELITFARQYTHGETKPLLICQRQKDLLFLINTFTRCGQQLNRYFNKASWDSLLNLKQAYPELTFRSYQDTARQLTLTTQEISEFTAFQMVTKAIYQKLTGMTWGQLGNLAAFQNGRYELLSNSLGSGLKRRIVTVLEDLPAHQKIIALEETTQTVLSFNYGTILAATYLDSARAPLTEKIQQAWTIEKTKNQMPLGSPTWAAAVEIEQEISYHAHPEVALQKILPRLREKFTEATIPVLLREAEEYSRSLGKPAWTKISDPAPLNLRGHQVRLLPEGIYEIDGQLFATLPDALTKFPDLVGKLPAKASFLDLNHPRTLRLRLQSSEIPSALKTALEAWLQPATPILQNLSTVVETTTSWRRPTVPNHPTTTIIRGHFFNTLTKQPEAGKYLLRFNFQEVLQVFATKLLVETEHGLAFVEFLPPHLMMMNTPDFPLTWEGPKTISLVDLTDLGLDTRHIPTHRISATLEIDATTFLAKLKAKSTPVVKAETSGIFASLSETLPFLLKGLKKIEVRPTTPPTFEAYAHDTRAYSETLQQLVTQAEIEDLSTKALTTPQEIHEIVAGNFGILQVVREKVELILGEIISINETEIYLVDRQQARRLRDQGYNRPQIIFMATKKISRGLVLNFYPLAS